LFDTGLAVSPPHGYSTAIYDSLKKESLTMESEENGEKCRWCLELIVDFSVMRNLRKYVFCGYFYIFL